MPDLQAVIVATMQGTTLSLQELIHTGRLNGKLLPLIGDAVADKLIASAARQQGITPSAAELQQAADNFRRELKLMKAADTHHWLAANQLTVEDLENKVERDLLHRRLAERVITQDQVRRHFAEHRTEYDRARLAHIVTAKEGVAREIQSQILEEGASFADLARKHSLDAASKQHGGSLGIVARKSLSPAVESLIFNAQAGDVVGPVKTDMGYHLIKVEELLLGQLTDAIAVAIRARLFQDWLDEQVRQANVQIKQF
jgi:parvulin-like peptidyl-prolyl isomerase